MPDANNHWQPKKLQSACFLDLEQLFSLSHYQQWPCLTDINQWVASELCFIDNRDFNSGLYYEQHIHQYQQVPTRLQHWHDFFNAIIWALFPKTKAYLNGLHVKDIAQHGLSPRTPQRNRATQFDECGVVIAYSDDSIPQHLLQHQWQQAFVKQRHHWSNKIQAFMFGHANYEMLIDPYIGMTGKWLGVKVPDTFWQTSKQQQYAHLDKQLSLALQQQCLFAQPGKLPPLPLLGVPAWHQKQQDTTFYNNKNYFRAKTQPTAYLQLLPQ